MSGERKETPFWAGHGQPAGSRAVTSHTPRLCARLCAVLYAMHDCMQLRGDGGKEFDKKRRMIDSITQRIVNSSITRQRCSVLGTALCSAQIRHGHVLVGAVRACGSVAQIRHAVRVGMNIHCGVPVGREADDRCLPTHTSTHTHTLSLSLSRASVRIPLSRLLAVPVSVVEYLVSHLALPLPLLFVARDSRQQQFRRMHLLPIRRCVLQVEVLPDRRPGQLGLTGEKSGGNLRTISPSNTTFSPRMSCIPLGISEYWLPECRRSTVSCNTKLAVDASTHVLWARNSLERKSSMYIPYWSYDLRTPMTLRPSRRMTKTFSSNGPCSALGVQKKRETGVVTVYGVDECARRGKGDIV
jgi:hypothetical protein